MPRRGVVAVSLFVASIGLKLGKTGWQEATPENNAAFSALVFAFGMSLQKELDVPVGLIEAAVGCSCAGHWIGQEALDSDPVIPELVKQAYAEDDDKKREALVNWRKAVKAEKKEGKELPFKPWEVRQPGDWVGSNKHTRRLGGPGCF